MKIKLHIPTEQYGFVEVEMEQNPESKNLKEPSEVVADAIELYNASKTPQNAPGSELGLLNKEWLNVVEHYLNTAELEGGAETWEKLNKYQRDWIQETKRALKRLRDKDRE